MIFATFFFSIILSTGSEILISKQGILNGTYSKARNGKTFNAYYGIPFAEPPIGSLRLKAPVAAKGWDGVRDASVPPSACLQIIKKTSTTGGSEDCLYLNVYTPLGTQKGANLSVIVYLYGGVYKSSSNTIDGPNFIMGDNVILVSPNYREGVLGFMSTGDSVIPGNFGLKDQAMALKWVQDNIYEFGGDPNSVTLQGHSSGAVCVHLHTLSPMSKGLFQKVIIQSGTGFCPLSYFGPDVVRAIAKEFTEKLGCAAETSEDILSCVLSIDPEVIPLIPESMYIWDLDPDAAFRPCIESAAVENSFITDFPENMQYHSPDLPWIIGLTTGEGAFKVARYLDSDGSLANEIDENYQLLFPITLQYLWNTKPNDLDYSSRMIRLHYFQDKFLTNETSSNLTDMYTHGLFGICTIEAIKTYPGPKYVYWYDYRSNYSTQNIIGYYPDYLGVSHGDEVNLLFYRSYSAELLNDQDVTFSNELVTRFLNFVNTGNPNQPRRINETIMTSWDPMSSTNIEYLFMNLNGTMKTGLYNEIYNFWKSLPLKNKYIGQD